MFQIEPILWLQSLESPGLTWLMRTVSALGYESTYAAILIILIFGIRLKQGMFVFICLLVAGIMVNGLKDGIQFPDLVMSIFGYLNLVMSVHHF